ncbi:MULTISPECIES: ribosomal protein S18-alanine N-acetyltransferase [unclassified Brevundimonas]|uniref:ribosomal protein S18-alanine N-acetyltransferase n=1 Tax=unclassified Brevundimonas TaxID=2622653 RepID=UPI0025BA9A4E|nr:MULTISPECIES: ribosomal protein S18-alanine N-acetyltransferase [unclassified Brevundimonas]
MTPQELADIHAEAFDTPWDEASFSELLRSPEVQVNGDARGFILTRTVLDEAEILTVAVRPSWRRQGLGRAMIEAAIVSSAALGAKQMFLEVAESNGGAIALYQSIGFQTVGLRKNYYKRADGSSEHAKVMVLNFSL